MSSSGSSNNVEDVTFLIAFINIVEKHPCLWNCTLKEYNKIDATALAWKAIASEIKDTEHNCRERWKNIRCAFVRSLKHIRSGSRNKSKKSYYLAKHLSFLLPYLKGNSFLFARLTEESQNNDKCPDPKDNFSHSIVDNDEKDASKDIITSASQKTLPLDDESAHEKLPPRKKKRLESQHFKTYAKDTEWINMNVNMNKQNQSRQEDSDLLFFRSLLPDLKKLDDRRKRNLKAKIISLLNCKLDELELEASSTPHSIASKLSTASWVSPANNNSRQNKEDINFYSNLDNSDHNL